MPRNVGVGATSFRNMSFTLGCVPCERGGLPANHQPMVPPCSTIHDTSRDVIIPTAKNQLLLESDQLVALLIAVMVISDPQPPRHPSLCHPKSGHTIVGKSTSSGGTTTVQPGCHDSPCHDCYALGPPALEALFYLPEAQAPCGDDGSVDNVGRCI